MTARSTGHATFVSERELEFSPKFVFRAWADPKAKARWLVGPEGWGQEKYGLDFRVGGREYESGGPVDGPTHHYNAVYQDIVPDERIIYAYDMHMTCIWMSSASPFRSPPWNSSPWAPGHG